MDRKPSDPPKRPLSPFNFNDFHYKRSVYTAFTSLSDGDMHGNDASESSGENPAPFKWCAMEIALWSLMLSAILMLLWIWKLRRDNRRKKMVVLDGLPQAYLHTPPEKYQDMSITEQDGSGSNPFFVARSSLVRSFKRMMILPELVLKRKESVNSPALGSAEPTIAQPHNASPTEKLGTGESFV